MSTITKLFKETKQADNKKNLLQASNTLWLYKLWLKLYMQNCNYSEIVSSSCTVKKKKKESLPESVEVCSEVEECGGGTGMMVVVVWGEVGGGRRVSGSGRIGGVAGLICLPGKNHLPRTVGR